MKIKIKHSGENRELIVQPGLRLLDYLVADDIPVNASCGGNGTCHKCRVKVEEGFLPITSVDRLAFHPSELEKGWRLSCQSRPRVNASIQIPQTQSLRSKPRVLIKKPDAEIFSPRLVCDLGSTGMVLALVGSAEKNSEPEIIAESHLLNRQVRFGADVMTRLAHALKGGTADLKQAVLKSFELLLSSLKEAFPEALEQALSHGIVCSGNSAMASFLQELSIESLAVSPFQPSTFDLVERFEPVLNTTLTTLPLLAGFVGGDTFAGILWLEKQNPETPWMLVDIGTNTEIVIKTSQGEYWMSSAPAGPAFEGGNITYGMRAEPGAIAHAVWKNSRWELEVIGGDIAQGICGSGLLDILSESVKNGLIGRDGLVPENSEGNRTLDITANLLLTADDIREFQLAKSATRTAVDLLIDRAKETPRKIYLAGTFAEHLRDESIRELGLLPPDIPYQSIGNASLNGAVIFSNQSREEKEKFIQNLNNKKHPIELALQEDFQEGFVKNLGL